MFCNFLLQCSNDEIVNAETIFKDSSKASKIEIKNSYIDDLRKELNNPKIHGPILLCIVFAISVMAMFDEFDKIVREKEEQISPLLALMCSVFIPAGFIFLLSINEFKIQIKIILGFIAIFLFIFSIMIIYKYYLYGKSMLMLIKSKNSSLVYLLNFTTFWICYLGFALDYKPPLILSAAIHFVYLIIYMLLFKDDVNKNVPEQNVLIYITLFSSFIMVLNSIIVSLIGSLGIIGIFICLLLGIKLMIFEAFSDFKKVIDEKSKAAEA